MFRLRNLFLNSTCLSPEDDNRTPAQIERDSIKVESTLPVEVKETTENENTEVPEETESAEIEAKVEDAEEKVEELEEQLEEDKTLTAKDKEKLEKRIEKERKKARDLKDENEALKRQLAAKPEGETTYSADDVKRLAKEEAERLKVEGDFEASVNRIADEAKKLDKDFQKKINALSEDMGSLIPPIMIEALDELPRHGADVLLYLAKDENSEEAESIWKMKPTRMAMKLKDISDKIKPKAKPVSKLPAPNDPLKGKGTTPDVLSDSLSQEEWFRVRNKQVEEKARAKQARMH